MEAEEGMALVPECEELWIRSVNPDYENRSVRRISINDIRLKHYVFVKLNKFKNLTPYNPTGLLVYAFLDRRTTQQI